MPAAKEPPARPSSPAAGGGRAATLDARREPRSRDHFDARPVPAAVTRVRPMPRISGSRARLDAAVGHLEALAEQQNIKVKTEPGSGVGWYDNAERIIRMDPEVAADPALRAWVLAHELAHALDPRFVVFGGAEYETSPARRADYELVAEAAARRAVMSFGLVVDGDDEYLRKVNPSWQRRIKGPLWDRYQASALPLLRPAAAGTPTAAQRQRTFEKAQRRAGADNRARQRGIGRSEAADRKTGSWLWRLLLRRR